MQFNEKLTCSALFIRPMVEISKTDLEGNNFINAYLDDISHDMHYEDCIYVLFKPHNLDMFQYFLTRERERITIIDDYDYEEYVIVVYKIPEKFLPDYQLFLEGKYSKFSEDLKKIFSKNSIQLQIITKDAKLKQYWEDKFNITFEDDQELWEKPDLSKEVLDIEEVKTNKEK